ncbi:hypothetical protein COMA2_30279 [Candidatus Nitrospira nitrificans]|uniref:Uncharacterized protein n=1 Tax=Candidatus Nitrospira nitrificans TaxID=1742973 RepID=A0A0S4LKI8_9BACT|nr:hypothetical protein COMA2_30279 [Candidatus Nitrospira nitrificans]
MASYYSGLLRPFTQSFVPAHFNNHFLHSQEVGLCLGKTNCLSCFLTDRSSRRLIVC